MGVQSRVRGDSLYSVVDFHPVASENTQSALEALNVLLKNIRTAPIAAIRDAVRLTAVTFIAGELGSAGWIKTTSRSVATEAPVDHLRDNTNSILNCRPLERLLHQRNIRLRGGRASHTVLSFSAFQQLRHLHCKHDLITLVEDVEAPHRDSLTRSRR